MFSLFLIANPFGKIIANLSSKIRNTEVLCKLRNPSKYILFHIPELKYTNHF